VGAGQKERVDRARLGHEFRQVSPDDHLRAFPVLLPCLDDGHEQRAGFLKDPYRRVELGDLPEIGLRGDDPLRGEQPHPAKPSVGHFLDQGTHDAEDAAVGKGAGQVFLLDAPQGLGRGGVAGDDDERAAPAKEEIDGLAG